MSEVDFARTIFPSFNENNETIVIAATCKIATKSVQDCSLMQANS